MRGIGRVVKQVRGDGFCLIHAVLKGLLADHMIEIQLQEAIDLVVQTLVDHHARYSMFHVCARVKGSETLSAADALVNEVMDFFKDRDYTADVVDLLVKVISDALDLNLVIFQETDGKIHKLVVHGIDAQHTVYLKFTRSQMSSLGNHYDAVVRRKEAINVQPVADAVEEEEEEDQVPEVMVESVEGPIQFPEDSHGQNIPQVSRGKYFPLYLFDDTEPLFVDHVPGEIDGFMCFKIDTSEGDWRALTRDLRHFVMRTSSRKNYCGTIKTGTCEGSYVCPNKRCPFRGTSANHQPNRVNWVNPRGTRDRKICKMCETVAEMEGCGARKLIDYNPEKEVALVYHIGKHRCWPKLDEKRLAQEAVRNRKNTTTGAKTAKEMAVMEIIHAIHEGIRTGDMSNLRNMASSWTGLKSVKQVLREEDPTTGEDHNSFDAVAVAKKALDELDEFYIFRINNGYMNNGIDYVFKSSKEMANIALLMDVDGEENVFQLENAYFDCCHTRVHGFKSIGMWTYHSTMNKIVRLASMELRSESTASISEFLSLFNEMLQKVSGKPGYKFNPRTFMCDEGSANYQAVRKVYGEDFTKLRVKGCQWHFKHNLHLKSKLVSEKERGTFTHLCENLCVVTTVTEYFQIKKQLDIIAERNPRVKNFLGWWHLRRSHVFQPFRGGGLPGVNLSEQGNAGWVCKTMRLVHAAAHDVATMVLFEEEMKKFHQNLCTTSGRGPSKAQREAKDRDQQMEVGEGLARLARSRKLLAAEGRALQEDHSYLPNQKGKHKPPEKKLRKKEFEIPYQDSSSEFSEEFSDYLSEEEFIEKMRAEYKRHMEKKKKRKHGSTQSSVQVDESEDEAPQPPPKKRGRPTKKKKISDADEDSEEEARPAPKKKRGRPPKNIQPVISTDEEEEEDLPAPPPPKKKKNEPKRKNAQTSKGRLSIDADVHQHKMKIALKILKLKEKPKAPRSSDENPPVVICTNGTNIRSCKGCNSDITKEDKRYPHNMVFRRRGETRWFNKLTRQWVHQMGNIHFHLKRKCLRNHYPSLNWRSIVMTDDVFDEMTEDQMAVLHELDLLKFIVTNLMD